MCDLVHGGFLVGRLLGGFDFWLVLQIGSLPVSVLAWSCLM